MQLSHLVEIDDPFTGVKGKITINFLRKGLFLKYADLTMGADPAEDKGLFSAGIRLIITLKGKTELDFGEQKMVLNADKRPMAVCLPISKKIYGSKHFEPNGTQKELLLFIEQDWLSNSNFSQTTDFQHFRYLEQSHLQPHFLQVNKKVQKLAQDIIADIHSSSMYSSLRKESCCLELIMELLAQLPHFQLHQKRSLKYKRIEQLTEMLLSGEADEWNLNQMAAFVHTNVTTMQRDFKQIHGTSVMHYLRQLKLERGYKALIQGKSIAQAAAIAGYSNPDNFSTAFRRYFNMVPSQIKKLHLSQGKDDFCL